MNCILMMICAFLVFMGCAFLFHAVLGMKSGEGFYVSASLVMMILYLSLRFLGTLNAGMVFLCVFSAAGYGLFVYKSRKSGASFTAHFDIAFLLMIMALVYGTLAYYGDFIQHIDEFHGYASEIKYLFERDSLIDWSTFTLGDSEVIGTALFNVFFQKFTGLNEGMMYAVSFFLLWIGILLPVTRFDNKNKRYAIAYGAVIFLLIFSIYIYPYKTLYTDLHCGAWAGGLCSWFTMRDKKQKTVNFIVIASGLLTLPFIKSPAGLIMAFFSLLFIISEKFFVENGKAKNSRIMSVFKWGYTGLFAVTFAGASALYMLYKKHILSSLLPSSLAQSVELYGYREGKEEYGLINLVRFLFSDPLAGAKSSLKLCTAFCIILFITLIIYTGFMIKKRKKYLLRSIELLYLFFVFFLGLAFQFFVRYADEKYEDGVFTFPGFKRYFAIFVIFLAIISLAGFLKENPKIKSSETVKKLVIAGLCIFLMLGLNGKFICNATSLNSKKIPGSYDIRKSGAEVKIIQSVLTQNDKVYIISQDTKNEYPQNVAVYYLQEQVQNYLFLPFRFIEGGCTIRLVDTDQYTIDSFPALLADGGYTYVWIYKTDDYLSESLPNVLSVTDENGKEAEAGDGQLYKVLRDANGNITCLEESLDLYDMTKNVTK